MATKALGDVWFRFESDDDEEPTHEANTFRDGVLFIVRHYHVDVGVVSEEVFSMIEYAWAWYADNGYQDFSS